ncbi:MAG TPA: UMP kinase [Treponema sp.]|nr:UMP kinase [Treponema sp.]
MYKRVLLKLSGEALSGEKGFGLDLETTRQAARQVKAAHEMGIEIAIVIGGGNWWRGRSSEGIDRVKADQIGMLATVMNCLYVSEVFRTEGMDTQVFVPYPIGLYAEVFSKDKALKAMKEGKVVFFAGGTGHPFFSTDMATALRAAETECDAVLMAKSIDGVYDSDPGKNPNAKRYDEMKYQEIIDKQLGVIDLASAILLRDAGIPAELFALAEKESIIRVIRGESIGTTIKA